MFQLKQVQWFFLNTNKSISVTNMYIIILHRKKNKIIYVIVYVYVYVVYVQNMKFKRAYKTRNDLKRPQTDFNEQVTTLNDPYRARNGLRETHFVLQYRVIGSFL